MDKYLIRKRNFDFFAKCEAIREEGGRDMPIVRIADWAAKSPAPSFYVTERTVRILLRTGRTTAGTPQALRRQKDILRLRKKGENLEAAVRRILLSAAPEFYLSPERARDLYYKLLKEKKK